jgi:hypothetical protein
MPSVIELTLVRGCHEPVVAIQVARPQLYSDADEAGKVVLARTKKQSSKTFQEADVLRGRFGAECLNEGGFYK